MSTSKKLYVAVAKQLADLGGRFAYSSIAQAAIDSTAHRLADIFEADNPAFDRERFLRASRATTQ